MQTAKRYAAALSVEPTSKTTSIVIVSLKNTNKRRGEDFINRLIEVYNRNTNNDKNEVAEKSSSPDVSASSTTNCSVPRRSWKPSNGMPD